MFSFDSSQVSFLRGDLADSFAIFILVRNRRRQLEKLDDNFDLCHIIFSCGHFHDVDIS